MNVVVIGGTGFIGRALCEALSRKGHRVTVLTRKGRTASRLFGSSVTAVEWNGHDPGVWEETLEGTDAVINLAGAPIADARWTDARKRLLTDSRVHLTRRLVRLYRIGLQNRASSSVPPASGTTAQPMIAC